MTLNDIWRINALFPILITLQAPTISALASYALCLASTHPARKFAPVALHPVVKLALGLVVMTMVSGVGGIYPGRTLSFLTSDFGKTIAMMFVLAVSIRSIADLELLMATQIIGAATYSAVIMSTFAMTAEGRLGKLIYYDANDLAMLLVMVLPMATYFLRSGTRTAWRLMSLAAFALITVTLVKTGSRGGFLGFLAVLTYLLFRFTALSRRVRLGAVIGLFGGVVLTGSEQYWQMMSTILSPEEDYNYSGQSAGGRMEIWKRGVGYMLQHPLTGVGASNFKIAEATISDRARERKQQGVWTKELAAHNSLVLVGAELGIPGLLIFVAMLYQAFKSLRSSGRSASATLAGMSRELALSQALYGSLIGYCVGGFFLSQTYSALLYALLGMTVALAKLHGRDVAAPLPAVGRRSRGAVPELSAPGFAPSQHRRH